MRRNSRVSANQLTIFMNTQRQEEKNKFLQFCIDHEVVPAEKSFESYKIAVIKTEKIKKLAMIIADKKDHSTICDLIKLVIDLRDEVIGFGDSEGVDTETEIVRNAQKWIKENIGE